MVQIAIQVSDEQKAHLLVEMLSAMNFVKTLEVSEVNGSSEREEDDASIFYRDPRQALMLQEEAAFKKMHRRLVKQYLGKYVAIYQGKVVAHDVDEMQIVARVQEQYPGEVVLIRQVQEKLPPFWFFVHRVWCQVYECYHFFIQPGSSSSSPGHGDYATKGA